MLLVFLAGPSDAVTRGRVVRHAHPYRQAWKKNTFGKRALAATAAGAGIQHARGRPKEWGGGVSGFGKRLASGFAEGAVKNTIKYTVAGIRHEDIRYHRSNDPRFSHRLGHALASTVVTHNTNSHRMTVAAGRLSGAMGSGLISRAWQPASARGVSAGFASGGVALGADAAANVAREFWPRHHAHRVVRPPYRAHRHRS